MIKNNYKACATCQALLTEDEIKAFYNDPIMGHLPIEPDEKPICFTCLDNLIKSL